MRVQMLQKALGNGGFARLIENGGFSPLAPEVAAEAPTAAPPAADESAPKARVSSGPREARAISRQASGAAGIQRWTMPFITLKSDEELVQDGKNGDLRAICEIRNWTEGGLAAPHRLDFIDKLARAGASDWRDRSCLERIWGSFSDLEGVVAANPERWTKTLATGADLSKLPAVVKLKDDFPTVLRDTAHAYLDANRAKIRQEQIDFGLLTFEKDEKPAAVTEEQSKKLAMMDIAAEKVSMNQKAQEAAKDTPVGYNMRNDREPEGGGSTITYISKSFDPFEKPEHDEDPTGVGPKPGVTWTAMKEKWDASVKSIKAYLKEYPALYAVARENSSETTHKFASIQSPQAARDTLGRALAAVITDIQGAEAKLKPDGGLNPLDLTPVADGLIDGSRKPENTGIATQWNKPLASYAAKEAIKTHELNKALRALGYELASQALFILSPFTGGASLFVALAGVGVLGAKAGESAQNYETLAQAAKTGVDPDKDIVNQQQVTAAEMEKQADESALALAAITVGAGAVVGAIKAIASAARVGRLATLVTDAELLKRLQALAQDDAALERLLKAANSPEAVETLLQQAGSAAKAEQMLGTGGIDYAKQLSSGGDKGSLAGKGKGFGVFEGRVPGVVEPVAIKVFPAADEAFARNEMEAAQAAQRAGGPRCYGQVPAPDGRFAFAMEKVAGEFAEAYTPNAATDAARARITMNTVAEAQNFGDRILQEGRYSRGDFQGLITKEGRWRPIDFGSYDRLPDPLTEKAAYDIAVESHKRTVKFEVESLTKIAQKNAAQAGP